MLGLLLLSVSACQSTSPLCNAVTYVSTSVATTVANNCGCNEAAVQATIYPLVNVAGVCVAPAKGGTIADIACPVAGDLLTGLLSTKFPAAWECTNASACVGNVVSVAVAACEQLPFKPKH